MIKKILPCPFSGRYIEAGNFTSMIEIGMLGDDSLEKARIVAQSIASIDHTKIDDYPSCKG